MVYDVFLDTTLKNLDNNNGRIAVSVYAHGSLEGYQIKGRVEYLTSKAIVDNFKTAVEKCSQALLPQRVCF